MLSSHVELCQGIYRPSGCCMILRYFWSADVPAVSGLPRKLYGEACLGVGGAAATQVSLRDIVPYLMLEMEPSADRICCFM